MGRFFFFFTDTPPTEIYTLSLHDALPISAREILDERCRFGQVGLNGIDLGDGDRKSTRLNSSHVEISYAVFCLKKKIIIVVVGDTSIVSPTIARCSLWFTENPPDLSERIH